ncbi:MAG TPA: hypothetical protein VFR58_17020 [Flavisolibacter sp.]|nr:hypothetical protein [Flavisolibacter sp.]
METASRSKWPSFFLAMAFVGLLATLVGFGKTFFVPVANGSFRAPVSVHIHGAFAFAWVILFLIQPALIHVRNYRLHQYLGMLGLAVAAGVVITMVPAGVFVVQRELGQGLGEISYSGLLGVFTSGLLFFTLVLAGIINRKSPAAHKRLMLLATIVVLWPAWFRFRHYFPSVPRPDIWFELVLADSLILIAWIWDKMRNGRIHPVLFYVGSFIIVEQSLEIYFFGSQAYQAGEKWLYGLFGY